MCSSAGISFTHGPIFGFFTLQGRHGTPIKVKFGSEELPAKFYLDRLRGGVYGPQNWKKWNFANIIAPKGRIPCTIFTKFIGFMRVLSLHNFAKFGCFILIHDKIINNFLRWGRFQPNFRWPLAAKLLMGPKNVWDLKWWHEPPLSPCKIWWKSNDAPWRERTKCDVFHFFLFVNNARAINGHKWRSCVIQEEIALAFIGWFRCCLQLFSRKKMPFQRIDQFSKFSLGGATIEARKTFKFIPVVPKVHGRTNVCAHQKSIKPCNFQKCFGGFL